MHHDASPKAGFGKHEIMTQRMKSAKFAFILFFFNHKPTLAAKTFAQTTRDCEKTKETLPLISRVYFLSFEAIRQF